MCVFVCGGGGMHQNPVPALFTDYYIFNSLQREEGWESHYSNLLSRNERVPEFVFFKPKKALVESMSFSLR